MTSDPATILVTGATGKVGQAYLRRLLAAPAFDHFTVRALCHNRPLPAQARLEVVQGDLSQRETARACLQGVTHVIHMAHVKETPEQIMDVAIKGLFWLLEEARASATFRQFILIGGDNAVGHCVVPHAVPVTEAMGHSPYPGCYALAKVLEEVMLEQYYVQYGLNGCCLRAPWIMEKDDFKYTLSFGEDVFGGPRWRDLVGAELADQYAQAGTVPILCDAEGAPILRNFVHVEDLVSAVLAAIDNPKARQQTFNICMDEPVDYGAVAAYLAASRGLPAVAVPTPYFSTWLDNTKAKLILGWRPQYDLPKLIDAAFDYQRPADRPRKVWYPG
jgi:nucleoside-diphosphate-sugar epimerase